MSAKVKGKRENPEEIDKNTYATLTEKETKQRIERVSTRAVNLWLNTFSPLTSSFIPICAPAEPPGSAEKERQKGKR